MAGVLADNGRHLWEAMAGVLGGGVRARVEKTVFQQRFVHMVVGGVSHLIGGGEKKNDSSPVLF